MVQNAERAHFFDLQGIWKFPIISRGPEKQKAPEMEHLDQYLSNKKIRLIKFCLSFGKSLFEDKKVN